MLARLEPRLRRLLEAVETGAGTVEDLAQSTDVAEVLAGLSELEFLGFVTRGPGGDYVRRV
jgi:predicted Rossmann fold nucleotide-binding protein DprA/Smf involved in DNA uptake